MTPRPKGLAPVLDGTAAAGEQPSSALTSVEAVMVARGAMSEDVVPAGHIHDKFLSDVAFHAQARSRSGAA